jgi:hypothetical protein
MQVYEGEHWALISERFPQFAENPKYVRLRLVTDGFRLFHRHSNRSSWPIILEFLNLPPEFRKKFHNILFAGLTLLDKPADAAPAQAASEGDSEALWKPAHLTFRAINRRLCDEFLVPLYEDGIAVWDAAARKPVRLHGMLVSTAHDSQAGCYLHHRSQGGYCYCLHCLERAHSVPRNELSKDGKTLHRLILQDARRHLPQGDPLRKRLGGVWTSECTTSALEDGRLTFGLASQVCDAIEARGTKAASDEAAEQYGIHMRSAFMDLPYAERARLVEEGALPVRATTVPCGPTCLPGAWHAVACLTQAFACRLRRTGCTPASMWRRMGSTRHATTWRRQQRRWRGSGRRRWRAELRPGTRDPTRRRLNLC